MKFLVSIWGSNGDQPDTVHSDIFREKSPPNVATKMESVFGPYIATTLHEKVGDLVIWFKTPMTFHSKVGYQIIFGQIIIFHQPGFP